MNVVGLALRSLRQRLLSTILTAFGVAIGVGLVVFVTSVRASSHTAFVDAARGCDVVVSGKGTTSFAAVMNAVFHVDKPVDTVPVARWHELEQDPRVLHAVPAVVGDVFRGFRVVGTTSAFFDAMAGGDGRPLKASLAAGGRVFPDDESFEAVVGAFAAARTGLGLGTKFTVTHGLEEGGGEHAHDEQWTVVGVLAPTGTPTDRAIFITLRSFFHVKGHEGKPAAPATPPAMDAPPAMEGEPPAHDADPDADHDLGEEVRALSTILVKLKAPGVRYRFAADWNAKPDVRASIPAEEIRRLFEIVQGVDGLLRAVAVLVLVSAALSILAALYNSMQGRRREIALLRALGARRAHVFGVVVLEAVLICLLGGVAGIALGHLGVAGAAPFLLEEVGVRLGLGTADVALWGKLAAGLVVLGLLAGLLPAWRAYRTPVARNLHPTD